MNNANDTILWCGCGLACFRPWFDAQQTVEGSGYAWAAFLVKRHFGSSYTNLTLDRRLASTSFAMALPPTAGIGLAWVLSLIHI